MCHVTLLYCQVDPKAKSKAKKSLLPLPIFPLMWQPLAHLNQCYSSNSLPFMQVSSRVVSALMMILMMPELGPNHNTCSNGSHLCAVIGLRFLTTAVQLILEAIVKCIFIQSDIHNSCSNLQEEVFGREGCNSRSAAT